MVPAYLSRFKNETIHSVFDLLDVSNGKQELIVSDCVDQFFPFFLFAMMFAIRFAMFEQKISWRGSRDNGSFGEFPGESGETVDGLEIEKKQS